MTVHADRPTTPTGENVKVQGPRPEPLQWKNFVPLDTRKPVVLPQSEQPASSFFLKASPGAHESATPRSVQSPSDIEKVGAASALGDESYPESDVSSATSSSGLSDQVLAPGSPIWVPSASLTQNQQTPQEQSSSASLRNTNIARGDTHSSASNSGQPPALANMSLLWERIVALAVNTPDAVAKAMSSFAPEHDDYQPSMDVPHGAHQFRGFEVGYLDDTDAGVANPRAKRPARRKVHDDDPDAHRVIIQDGNETITLFGAPPPASATSTPRAHSVSDQTAAENKSKVPVALAIGRLTLPDRTEFAPEVDIELKPPPSPTLSSSAASLAGSSTSTSSKWERRAKVLGNQCLALEDDRDAVVKERDDALRKARKFQSLATAAVVRADSAETEVLEARSQMKALLNTHAKERGQLDELKEKLQSLSDAKSAAEGRVLALESELSTARMSSDESTKVLGETVAGLRASLEDSRARLVENEDSITKLGVQLESASEEVLQLTQRAQAAEEAANHERRVSKDTHAMHERAVAESRTARDELASVSTELEAARAKTRQLEKSMVQSEEHLEGVRSELHSARADLTSRVNELEKLQEKLAEAHAASDAASKSLKASEAEADQGRAELEARDRELATANNALSEAEDRIACAEEGYSARIRALEDCLAAAQRELDTGRGRTSAAELNKVPADEHTAMLTRAEAAEERNRELESALLVLRDEMRLAEVRTKDAESNAARCAARAAEAQTTAAQYQDQASEARTRADTLSKSVLAIEQKLNSAAELYRRQLDKAQAENETLSKTLDTAQEASDDAERRIADLQCDVKEARKQLEKALADEEAAKREQENTVSLFQKEKDLGEQARKAASAYQAEAMQLCGVVQELEGDAKLRNEELERLRAELQALNRRMRRMDVISLPRGAEELLAAQDDPDAAKLFALREGDAHLSEDAMTQSPTQASLLVKTESSTPQYSHATTQ